MSLFEDKQYKDMDWLSQAIEPIIDKTNDLVSTLPEEIVFSNEDILSILEASYEPTYVSMDPILIRALEIAKITIVQPYTPNFNRIKPFYEVQIEGDVIVNIKERTVSGGGIVKLVKVKKMYEQEELMTIMLNNVENHLNNIRETDIDRINEIADLLGYDCGVKQKRTINAKLDAMQTDILKKIREGHWNIKSTELAGKVGHWIRTYIESGNLAALTNFCKFKVMTHDGSPIYSVVEEKL